MGTLFLVATPIGNLEDISPRALHTLGSVSLVAAEDTRKTRVLLDRYTIRARLASYHDHNKEKKTAAILKQLEDGDVALVSDAGMPGLNDPGYELVQAAVAAGHIVSPIPGPSAPIAALVASGLPPDSFLYLGYLPRKKKERRAVLEGSAAEPHTLVFFETPHRLMKALEDLEAVLGDRRMAVAREMTKLHEEFVRGRVSEVREHFSEHPPRGEITLVVAGAEGGERRWTEEQVKEAVRDGLQRGESAAGLAKRLAGESGWARRAVYAMIQDLIDLGDY